MGVRGLFARTVRRYRFCPVRFCAWCCRVETRREYLSVDGRGRTGTDGAARVLVAAVRGAEVECHPLKFLDSFLFIPVFLLCGSGVLTTEQDEQDDER